MASTTLYPPIVDSTMDAFLANSENGCVIYFRLSKFNVGTKISSVQATIVKQDTNMNVLDQNTKDIVTSEGKTIKRHRSTGILLDLPISQSIKDENLYYTQIFGTDLVTGSFTPGWIYKVQLRLSPINYSDVTDGTTEASWLSNNASVFSEWSTVCTIKATGPIDYEIPILNINTADTSTIGKQTDTYYKDTQSELKIHTLYLSTLQIAGHFFYPKEGGDPTEDIYCIRLFLYDNNDNLIENSGEILLNQFQDNLSFNYTLKTELEDQKNYSLSFQYETRNHLIGGFYENNDEVDERYHFISSQIAGDSEGYQISLITIDNNSNEKFPNTEDSTLDLYIHKHSITYKTPLFKWDVEENNSNEEYNNSNITLVTINDITSLDLEEEDGYIAIKIFSNKEDPFFGNLCIRRTDSRSNFEIWNDMKIIVIKGENINQLPLYKDFTIESGVQYKYGVQIIDQYGYRTKMNSTATPSIRVFNNSFILGKDGQQLKLRFDNAMGNFKYQFLESKIDTLGGIYPRITRNAATKYKTFPINGLISFNMDDNGYFITKEKLYKDEKIIQAYNNYNNLKSINKQYDFIYEKDFRDTVLDFLQDGEFKLYKSPTEGNIIVRLMDINCVPNQSLGRMIYSFSSTAYEMDANTLENYIKYRFFSVGEWSNDFKQQYTLLGQIQATFNTRGTDNPTNLFDLILDKYDSRDKNQAGKRKTIKKISHIKITFEDKPMRILSDNGLVLGYRFFMNTGGKDNFILVRGDYSPFTIYEIDDRISFNGTELNVGVFNFDGSYEENGKSITTLNATIDFLYTLEVDKYIGKQETEREQNQTIGQYSGNIKSNVNLRSQIIKKYYFESTREYRKVNRISSIEIEAAPYSVFLLKDYGDRDTIEEIKTTVGETGILSLYELTDLTDLIYLGRIDKSTGEIDSSISTDILITYIATIQNGKYEIESD